LHIKALTVSAESAFFAQNRDTARRKGGGIAKKTLFLFKAVW